ncbi:YveK family protein [Jeotgalibaca sp. A122]|uniref:YveK family protein n=1 Tax=Jeotgalibaca sp. A122 TaxID=3457322 RepID=UPI003FD30A5F
MEERFYLNEVFLILRKRVGQIVLFGILGLLIAGIFTFFFITPKYSSTSKMVVNQTQNTEQTLTNTDIQTNLNLINTYQSIIKEPIILEDVIGKVDSNISPQELSQKLSVQTENNSLVFGVTVSDENPYMASDLANAVAETFQEKIGDILEVESVTILSQATPNTKPVSPNVILNLIIGLSTGLMVGISLALVSELMDKRVKDNKIIDEIGWTNLGSILEMSAKEIKDTRIDKKIGFMQMSTSVSPFRRRV